MCASGQESAEEHGGNAAAAQSTPSPPLTVTRNRRGTVLGDLNLHPVMKDDPTYTPKSPPPAAVAPGAPLALAHTLSCDRPKHLKDDAPIQRSASQATLSVRTLSRVQSASPLAR